MNSHSHRCDRSPEPPASGFVLFTALLLVLMAGILLALLPLRLSLLRQEVLRTESQLRCRILAENGIEYGRALLPLLDLPTLLVGQDGRSCATTGEWRSPMPIDLARRIDPAVWQPECDDGLPFLTTGPIHLRSDLGGGTFAIRFSNDPEEPPDQDRNREVLLRSMGIVPLNDRSEFLPHARNQACLLEARYRQERPFHLEAALTVFGDSGVFQWVGQSFTLAGDEGPALAWASLGAEHQIRDQLLESLETEQVFRIQADSANPMMQEVGSRWRQDPHRQRLFTASFWSRFLENLPLFAQRSQGGLTFLESPGRLELDLKGIAIVRGDLRLAGSSRIEGLLLHLGAGGLTLEDDALVEGGVWLSNPIPSERGLESGEIRWRIADRAAIRYNPANILRAQGALPPTQLEWRAIFPETHQ